jgi:hypothetical protein
MKVKCIYSTINEPSTFKVGEWYLFYQDNDRRNSYIRQPDGWVSSYQEYNGDVSSVPMWPVSWNKILGVWVMSSEDESNFSIGNSRYYEIHFKKQEDIREENINQILE